MIRPAAVLRGMAQRGGTTLMILAVALVATAAAAAGPIYYQAARTSILRDTVARTGFAGRGYEANETGAVPGLLGQLDQRGGADADHHGVRGHDRAVGQPGHQLLDPQFLRADTVDRADRPT